MVGYVLSLVLVVVVACVVIFTCRHYWVRVYGEDEAGVGREFLLWVAKGVAAPVLIWVEFNSVLVFGGAPYLPGLQILKLGGGPWVAVLLYVIAAGVLVISFYWAAASFGWMLSALLARRPDLASVGATALIWTLLVSPLVGVVLWLVGWYGTGLALAIWWGALTHAIIPLTQPAQAAPAYGAAVARMKFGKYAEAEREVLSELEQHQDDFDGWMMLADLYANHFQELDEADRVVRQLCDQTNVDGAHLALAFHRLADWHLKVGEDPARARAALEEIRRRLPGSYFAREAWQRIARLPTSRQALRQERKARTVRLPALRENLAEAAAEAATPTTREQAASLANQCVQRLKEDPGDTPTREKFARILAEQLGQVDLAVEQLQLLVAAPDQPESKCAEWLATMAAWRIRHQQNWPAARPLLERLIQEYPQSPQAFVAQRRIQLMDVEARMRQAAGGKPSPPP
jgi:hypothetical protein